MSGTVAQQSSRSKLPSSQMDQKSTEAPVSHGGNASTSSSNDTAASKGLAAQSPNPSPSEGAITSQPAPTGPHLTPRQNDQTSSSAGTSQGTLLSAQTGSSTHNTGSTPTDVKGISRSVGASVLESSLPSKAPEQSNGSELHAVPTGITSQSYETARILGPALRAGSLVQQQLQGTLKEIFQALDPTASSMSHNTESTTQMPPRGTQESAASAGKSSHRSSPSVDSPADSTLRRDKAKRRRLPWMTPDRQGQSDTPRTIKTETPTAASATRFARRPETPASNVSEEDPVAQQQRVQLQKDVADCEKALQKHTACYDRLDGTLDKTADELRLQRDALSALKLSVQRWEEELKQKQQELCTLDKQQSALVQQQKEELKGKEKELHELKKQQTDQAQQVQQLKKDLELKEQEVRDLKKQQTDQAQKFQLQEKDWERKLQAAARVRNDLAQQIQQLEAALEKRQQELHDMAKHHREQVQQTQQQVGELRNQLKQKSEQAQLQKDEYERKMRDSQSRIERATEQGRLRKDELRRKEREVQDLLKQRNEQAALQKQQLEQMELKQQKLQKSLDLMKQQNDQAQHQKEESERKLRELMKQRDDQAHVHDKQLEQRRKELEQKQKELEQKQKELEKKQQTLRDLEKQQNETFQRQHQELDQRQQRLNDLTAEQKALAQQRRDELDQKQQQLRDQAHMHQQELDRKKEEVDRKKQEVLDLIKRQHEEAQRQQAEVEQKKRELDALIKQSDDAAATDTATRDGGGKGHHAANGDSSGSGPSPLGGLDQALSMQRMQQTQPARPAQLSHSRSSLNVLQQLEFRELSYEELSRNLRQSQAHQLPAPSQAKGQGKSTRKASFRQAKIYPSQPAEHDTSSKPATTSSGPASANPPATPKTTTTVKKTTSSKAKNAAQTTSQPSRGDVQQKQQLPSNRSGADTVPASGTDTIKGRKRRRESDAPPNPARTTTTTTAAPPSALVAPPAREPVPPALAASLARPTPSINPVLDMYEAAYQKNTEATMQARSDWSQPRAPPPPPPPPNATS